MVVEQTRLRHPKSTYHRPIHFSFLIQTCHKWQSQQKILPPNNHELGVGRDSTCVKRSCNILFLPLVNFFWLPILYLFVLTSILFCYLLLCLATRLSMWHRLVPSIIFSLATHCKTSSCCVADSYDKAKPKHSMGFLFLGKLLNKGVVFPGFAGIKSIFYLFPSSAEMKLAAKVTLKSTYSQSSNPPFKWLVVSHVMFKCFLSPLQIFSSILLMITYSEFENMAQTWCWIFPKNIFLCIQQN